ncbi:hypothetical protein GCM10011506_38240 [Marivirga lumbricoides]|uniref:Lipoprotein n=2 Tax=Marivirga lumbricoides TaxID=1046115 RepID=A0ABQ1N2D9_9BACT|nr:hypothetical protein GCM10011506_38240 [Marivirga lumbricoides]
MKYFLLFLLIVLGFSCQTGHENIELTIIKSTLPEVVGPRHYMEPPPAPPRKAFLPDSSELRVEPDLGVFVDDQWVSSDSLTEEDNLKRVLERKKWFDSTTLAYKTFDWEQYQKDSIEWANSLDFPRPKKRVILKIFDSLITNQKKRIKRVSNLGFKEVFEVELKGEFAELLTQLQDSTISPIPINFQNFSSLGGYQIRVENYQPTDEERVVATLVLSRVAINEERTKAAYYYQEFCGILCGYGYVVFAELTTNGWKVIGKNMVWIS